MHGYFSERIKDDPATVTSAFADEPELLADEAASVARYRESRGLLP